MLLRQIQSEEIDAILDLHLEGLERELVLFNKILDCRDIDRSHKAQLISVLDQMFHTAECNAFVAIENETYIGYCLVTKKIYPVENPKICGCINGIFVKDEYRKRGLGRELVQLAEDWLKSEGVTYLELYHMINDERAATFWQKMGYVNIQLNCAKKLS